MERWRVAVGISMCRPIDVRRERPVSVGISMRRTLAVCVERGCLITVNIAVPKSIGVERRSITMLVTLQLIQCRCDANH